MHSILCDKWHPRGVSLFEKELHFRLRYDSPNRVIAVDRWQSNIIDNCQPLSVIPFLEQSCDLLMLLLRQFRATSSNSSLCSRSTSPASVRSTISSRSISASAPIIWKRTFPSECWYRLNPSDCENWHLLRVALLWEQWGVSFFYPTDPASRPPMYPLF